MDIVTPRILDNECDSPALSYLLDGDQLDSVLMLKFRVPEFESM